eukprot:14819-Heterococcus_DN1.PRE.2
MAINMTTMQCTAVSVTTHRESASSVADKALATVLLQMALFVLPSHTVVRDSVAVDARASSMRKAVKVAAAVAASAAAYRDCHTA